MRKSIVRLAVTTALALCAAPAWADTTVIHAGAIIADASGNPTGPVTINPVRK